MKTMQWQLSLVDICQYIFLRTVLLKKVAISYREQNTPILTEVSPDGSIRKVLFHDDDQIEIGDVKAAVEIKCPFPSDRQLPVHYILPECYVCQCLAEMVALNTNLLVYISYSAESSTLSSFLRRTLENGQI